MTDGAAVNETGRRVNAWSNESEGTVLRRRRGQAALPMAEDAAHT